MTTWKTSLSTHALDRLRERTQIDEKTLCKILDEEETISLGFEKKESNRESLLFFSPKDEKFFVIVQDQRDGIVITVLTIEYWHNLSEKFFSKKLSIKRDQLIKAILISDPENIIKYHRPISNENYLYLTCKVESKHFGIGKIEIDLFSNKFSQKNKDKLKLHILKKIESKGIEENKISSINWAVGPKELKVNNIETFGTINFSFLFEEIKKDLKLREKLSKRYDDFIVILERKRSLQSIDKRYLYGKFT